MFKELPPLSATPPECNRTDRNCPAYKAHKQAIDELGMAKLLRDSAEHLREKGYQDENTLSRLVNDANRYEITAKTLAKAIPKLRKRGELCSNCPY